MFTGPPTARAMNEYQFEVKEVKCGTIGEFMVLTEPYMDEEADLLAWTNELTYPASAFTAAGVGTDEGSTESGESLRDTGRKRLLWENDGVQQPQTKRVAVEPNGELKTENEENKPKLNATDNGETTLPLWQNDELGNVPTGFENGLTFNINDTLMSPNSMTVFKQEGDSDGGNLQIDTDNNCTLQRLLQSSGFPQRATDKDCRFQYVLAAATSIASKQGEETLTYLNQGQSYGIKLKKVGELLAFKGKLMKSVIRLQFHERRLQYSEKEQILAWQAAHPGERIVELDVPLSYGLFDVEHDSTMVNTLSFCWDPTQEVGAYIKVNSISTEFTPKKHGGEKGVPFRIQVETYIQGDTYRLHAAACQIRVFKLKGADRKHKQEREKWLKLPEGERVKFQPPYESTILSDVTPDAATPVQPFVSNTSDSGGRPAPPTRVNAPAARARPVAHLPALPSNADVHMEPKMEDGAPDALSPMPTMVSPPVDPMPPAQQQDQFSVEMNREQVSAWLLRNGFEMLANTFCHFSGPDMMRLTRNDFISMCGMPNGLRLFYAIRAKPAIRLTMYVSLPGKNFHIAMYLNSAKSAELKRRVAALLNMADTPTYDLFMAGPNGIQVLVTDELLSNVPNEAAFSLNFIQADASGRCCLLLKSASA